MSFQKPLIIDFKIALEKAAKYCAYQERCHWEVEKKFREWNIDEEIQDEVISELIQQNFLNEERYAKAFVQGKVNIKKWGRYKIKMELQSRQISTYSVNKALQEIDEEKYILNLQELLQKKAQTVLAKNDFEKKMKLLKFLSSKGYETEIINEQIENHGITG